MGLLLYGSLLCTLLNNTLLSQAYTLASVFHTHTHTHTHAHTLQQDQVLSEIEKHGAVHSKSDEMTLHYLKALNNIFERGVLCREHISSSNQTVLDRMEKGFDFFSKWRKNVIDQGEW